MEDQHSPPDRVRSDSYYRWFPGDYIRDTGDLSMLEHGAYRNLLDAYYSEVPIPVEKERIYRICRAFSPEEKKAVDHVVKRFFRVVDNRLVNNRADREIAARRAFKDVQSTRAKKRAGSAERDAKGHFTRGEDPAKAVHPRESTQEDPAKDLGGGADAGDPAKGVQPRTSTQDPAQASASASESESKEKKDLPPEPLAPAPSEGAEHRSKSQSEIKGDYKAVLANIRSQEPPAEPRDGGNGPDHGADMSSFKEAQLENVLAAVRARKIDVGGASDQLRKIYGWHHKDVTRPEVVAAILEAAEG